MKIGVLYCGYVQNWKDVSLFAADIDITFETTEIPTAWDVHLVCILWDGCSLSINHMRSCCEENGVPYIVLKADLLSHMRLCGGNMDIT